MRVLSLFDGISCGRIALERANITVEKYYASEINKDAIKVSQDNWNDIIQLGDINNWKQWDIDWSRIDLLIGGSPCQGFSFAGKQLNFEDERSKLFFTFVDILNHIKKLNPNIKFLLENVKMKKEYQDIISQCLGIEPININSSLLSAQLRNRFYWCNWKVEQPKDKGILLKDILISGTVDREKSRCILESESRPLKTQEKILRRYKEIGFSTIVFENNYVRYLNQLELERLQTLPKGYTKSVNRNKAAGLIGNGWTIDIVSWIFSFINIDNE
jgi:site-specific DNA-cytosine methylase